MKCPVCQLELRIVRSRNVLENDDRPDATTKLYVEQDMSCLNKECRNYQKIIDTVRLEQPIG